MRFYRLLLRLYPFSFGADYESEMADVFAEKTRGRASLGVALAALFDVIPNAIAAHVELLAQDLRFAARSLLRSPGFATTAILVAALGVGANTAAFSLADFVLVRPLPFKDPSRILKLWQSNQAGVGRNEQSPANYRDIKEQSKQSFDGMAAYTIGAANLVGRGEPRRIELSAAEPDLFPLLGVAAQRGRTFNARDAATEKPILLSYRLWQTQFGGDPDILGRGVKLDDTPYTIVGIMPATFQFPSREIEAWTALAFSGDDMEERDNTYIHILGRLRDGVSAEQARSELTAIAARLEKQFPENENTSIFAPKLEDEVGQRARMLVLTLCGAALCILLLSCANLASLFLARGAHRARELAVRAALGAGRDRLVRQLVTESFAIALIGGTVGVLVAVASLPLLARLVPNNLPIAATPTLDLRVLAVAATFIVLTGLAFGVLPAIRAGRGTDLDALHAGARTSGGRTQRLRAAMVLIEIVASVVLLISSGLLIRAVWHLQGTDPGFNPDSALTVGTALPWPKYEKVATRAQFYRQVLEDVRALPGVKSAGYATGLPMRMRGMIGGVQFPGREITHDGSEAVSMRFVTSQYFAAMQIPIRRGRDVAESDTQQQPGVAVVSESFVKQHFPNEDAMGKHFKLAGIDRTIVGIVGDVRVRGFEAESEPQVYLSYQQVEDASYIGYVPKVLVVRTTVTPASLLAPIQRIVWRADADQPVSNVATLASIVEDETASRLTQVRLLGTLAAIALLIAAVGIHGLLAFAVSRRAQELGVRRALGAQVSTIVGLVLREGITLAAIGIAIGVLIAYAAARGMGALLAGIRPEDPITFAVASALCFVTVLVGCLRPALRAARVDPMIALRTE